MILRPLQSPKQSHWHRLHRYIDLGSWCVARTLKPVWVDSYRLRLPRNYVRLFTKDYDTRWWKLFLDFGEKCFWSFLTSSLIWSCTGVIWSYIILVASFEPPGPSVWSHPHSIIGSHPTNPTFQTIQPSNLQTLTLSGWFWDNMQIVCI